MKKILLIGAGRSATVLIGYLLEQARQHDFFVTVADANEALARQKTGDHPNGRAVRLDAANPADRRDLVARHDVVVSMLPPQMHIEVALDCLALGRHLLTASYVSPAVQALDADVRSHGLVFMNELGLDPGLDHMSAMQRINAIRADGGNMTAFYSHCGGLVAPESDDNPWHYKFSWNPRNVVLAGQGTAQYLEDGKMRFVPYRRLFGQHRLIEVPGMGQWEVYANRDSLHYREAYGLADVRTLLRGTIRHRGYCTAWDALVQIGLTDGNFPIPGSENLTYLGLMEAYSGGENGAITVRERIADLIGSRQDGPVMHQLDWLGLFDERPIGLKNATPALVLEHLLLEKWALRPDDKDMVIMQHEFEYELDGRPRRHISTLVATGNDGTDTAMSRLVGLPLGVFAKLLLLGEINTVGVNIPIMPEVYEPVLAELESLGVRFEEREG
ncbi:MAG: saccharopine dehydrogenase C-terminal domain-containing protein [Saprospiraceae bacterium]